MEIKVQNPEMADSVLPIVWCFSSADKEYLIEYGITHPWVLISVARIETNQEVGLDKSTEEDREYKHKFSKVIRANRLMEYLQFTGAGYYQIRIGVLGDKRLSASDLVTLEQSNPIRPRNGTLKVHAVMDTSIDVHVPKEMFSAEPPAWLKNFVAFVFNTPFYEPCQFRRRVIAAVFLVLPVVVLRIGLFLVIGLGYWILTFAMATRFLLMGKRGLKAQYFLGPLGDFEFDELKYLRRRRSAFRYKADGSPRSPWVVWSAAGALLVGLHSIATYFWGGPEGPFVPAVQQVLQPRAVILLALICAAATALVGLVGFVEHKSRQLRQNRQDVLTEQERLRWLQETELRQKEEARRRTEAALASLDLAVCSQQLQPTLNALPRSKRTIYLRYRALKARVCKPYARMS